MRTLLAVALPEEASCLPHSLVGTDVSLLITGPGKVMAALNTASWLAANPVDQFQRVVNIGTAGLLNPYRSEIKVGDVVEVARVIERDFDRDAIARLTGRQYNPAIHTSSHLRSSVTCATGDSFVSSSSIEKINHATVGIDPTLVDMEAFGVGAAAAMFSIPFYCVKYVTDYAGGAAEEAWKATVADAAEALASWVQDHLTPHEFGDIRA